MQVKNVILDLDQTIISAIPRHRHNPKSHEKSKSLSYKLMDDSYVVYERPHLQPFLDFLFANFNVSVWTAASKNYGLFILREIVLSKNERRLDYFLHNNHCKISDKKTGCPKDLDMIFSKWKLPGYDKTNTLIIDDLNEVHSAQPNNCINIAPFEFFNKNSEVDSKLVEIMKHLKNVK